MAICPRSAATTGYGPGTAETASTARHANIGDSRRVIVWERLRRRGPRGRCFQPAPRRGTLAGSRPRRRNAVFTLLTLACLAAEPERASITGTVRDEKGRAVAGASVFVRTAGPRVGVGVL